MGGKEAYMAVASGDLIPRRRTPLNESILLLPGVPLREKRKHIILRYPYSHIYLVL
jgi:hypothetical protein